MSPGLKSLLLNAVMTCAIVLGTLAAYDRVVVRPAQLIGVVDVAEVYRQKEAEFTLILTRAASDGEREQAMRMARSFAQRLPLARLMTLGLKLGADVPFFLGGGPAFVEGIGEVLHPLKLPERRYAVLKGPAGLATKDIFSSPRLARSENLAIVAGFPATARTADELVGGFGRNDLQPAAEEISSEVREALALLSKTFGNARMTGSGAAVFSTLAGAGENGKDDRSLATLLEQLSKDGASGWTGRICCSLAQHPLAGWAD